MSRSTTTAMLCVALLAACQAKDDGNGKEATLLQVSRSASAIVADGASTVEIYVRGAKVSPITVTTDRGHFGGGATTATILGLEGDIILYSCDAAVAGCLGSATVVARDGGNAIGNTRVLFTSSEICDNGADDDLDGETDCADDSCPMSVLCNEALGLVCAANGTCTTCSGGGGAAETAEQSCRDGFDNDCDGSVDCADADCAGRTCATATLVGTCESNACVCEPTEAVEAKCSNGLDDDCDGFADCADPNCIGKVCDTDRGLACGGSPVSCSLCTSGQTNELAGQCRDGRDNDCDGLEDCEDPDCDGQACNEFGGLCATQSGVPVCSCASGQVAEYVCNDNADNDCNGLVDCADPNCATQVCGPTASSVCEDFECVDSATKYSIKLTPVRARLPAFAGALTAVELLVTFEGQPAPGLTVDLDAPVLLGATSVPSVTTNAAGKATFNFVATGAIGAAEVTGQLRGLPTTGKTTITMPALGEIKFAETQYPVMGVRYSGYQESNNLAVQLLDIEQKTYPAGLPVHFRHLTLGGSTITGPLAPDEAGVCESPWCVSYFTATDAQGIARVTLYSGTVAGTVSISAESSAGGQPARNFDIPAIAIIGAKASGSHLSVVCSPENIPALSSTTCSTSLIDSQFQCVAILKDRFNNILGRATTVTFMSEAGAVGQPAVTPAYDPGSPPTAQDDLGIAVEIVNTLGNKLPKDVPPHQGAANPYGVANLVRGDPRWEYGLAYDDLLCNPAQVHNPRDGVVTVIASTPGEEGFFDSNGNGTYDVDEPFVDLPEPYVDYDDDNTRDLDEPFIDSNSNGTWDDENGRWDANAKIWTQTVVVYTGLPQEREVGGMEQFSRWMTEADLATFPLPTPEPTFTYYQSGSPNDPKYAELWLASTDPNFNWLSSSATYGVYYSWLSDVVTGYLGQDKLPDTKGLSYVYWPCDAADLTRCASDCGSANTPPPEHCVMRSVLRGYRYGYTPEVRLSGGAGPMFFEWRTTVLGFTRHVTIQGNVLP